MKLYIVQPAIPKYRLSFFEKLSNRFDTCVISTNVDFLGVRSADNKLNSILSDGFFGFLGMFWHKDLPFSVYEKGDVVILPGNPRVVNYMLLLLFLKFKGISTIWMGHGWTSGRRGVSSKIRIFLMRFATKVLVYTEKEKDQLQGDNVYALNNGLDSSSILNSISELDRTYNRVPNLFNLVFIGRITEKSNLGFLLQAMQRLTSDIRLHIIGTGDTLNFFSKQCELLGISDRVIWHGALFDELEIAKVMTRCDAFIYTGSVGLSLIHAFNYSLPAILPSNEQKHMPEFSAFKNNFNGMLYEEGDIEDLVNKINHISTISSSEFLMLRTNARTTVQETYNAEDMFNRVEHVISTLT